MAFLTATGSAPWPHPNSPQRDFIQASAYGLTNGVLKIAGTLTVDTSTSRFVATRLCIAVYDATSTCTGVDARIRNDTVIKLSGRVNQTVCLDFTPTGLQSKIYDTTTNYTSTCELVITGGSIGASAFLLGYFN